MFFLNRNSNYILKIQSFSLKRKLTHGEWIQPKGYDTGIKIYNCVVQKKVPLILKNQNIATWYTCGPTVYDSAHIGHASCYVKLDILQKIIKNYFHINLVTAMNITDIDDKIIKRSSELDIEWSTIAAQYESEFWNDLLSLDIDPPDIKVKVSDNIPEIIQFVKEIIDKNMAYKSPDGSVYFKTEDYERYGKLQPLNLESVERESKKSSLHFALWKGVKDNEPSWIAPWGSGRPGWHIECSAMASTIFGDSIDIHAGGLDLKFPHHENEETQSCVFHGKNQWVNYWVHSGYLHVQGNTTEKMSKSLKNTIPISEMLDMFSPEAFRISCLLSHYRANMEFSLESMNTAESVLKKIISFFQDSRAYTDGLRPRSEFDSALIYEKIKQTAEKIDVSLRDDFDTAKALNSLMDLQSFVNKIIINNEKKENISLYQASNPAAIHATTNFILSNLSNFGLTFSKQYAKDTDSVDLDEVLTNILEIRNKIRETAKCNNNTELFKICDDIRDSLKKSGIEIKDHGKMSSWNLINNE